MRTLKPLGLNTRLSRADKQAGKIRTEARTNLGLHSICRPRAVNWIDDSDGDKEVAKFKAFVSMQLELQGPDDPRLIVERSSAQEYMSNRLTLEELGSHFPAEEQVFGEVGKI